jgi:tetratricopeptide (TPR) repeat protein/predicted Ser/Thr protein kinase
MIGQTLKHYRIVEKLGQGGMGVVYKALDTHLDRFVAVKVLPHDKVADGQRKRRFVQEAKAASALNHPNIVTIHDIDESDGVDFIAMEYVEGKTLQELIRDKELGLSESLGYTIQIADALSKAHSAGIVHRDLKPSNVMITPDGRAKVLDFGLAKLTDRPAGEEDATRTLEQLTGQGVIMGTLSYMSPEQARGQELDHRTDIFALGVALYQMITGELPFQGPNAVSVLDQLLHAPTPSLKAAQPDVPDALERTVIRATAKDRDARYQSMQELASDLRSLSFARGPAAGNLGAEEATLTAAAPGARRPWRPGRRTAVLSAAVVLLGMLLALPFRTRLPRWLGGKPLPERIRLAVLPFNNIGGGAENQAFCDGLMEILATKFSQVQQFQSTLSVVPASEVRSEKTSSAAQARRMFHANLALTGSVRSINDKILVTINLVDAETVQQLDGKELTATTGELIALQDDAFDNAVAMLELNLKPDVREVLSAGETRNPAAYSDYLQAVGYLARFDITENVDKAINLFQQALSRDRNYALAYAGLGEAYWRKFQVTSERKWADEALPSCRRAAQLDNRLARVHVTLGMIYTGIGQPEKAADELKLAINLEPRGADGYRELGRAYEAMGKTGEAEQTYRQAIKLQPDSWSSYWNLGVFYYRQARYEQAATQFREVIRLAPDHFRAYRSLGGIYIYEGKFGQAAEAFDKSLAIRPSSQTYSNLGASYILQGRPGMAVAVLEKGAKTENAGYEVWGNLGDAYLQTAGMSGKARAAYTRAVELVKEQLAVNRKNAAARANLAYYLMRLEDRRRALDEIENARALAPKDQEVLFSSALVYELAGDRGRALTALAAAAAGGYSLPMIRATSDLAELRKDPRYQDLVEQRSSH